MQKIKIASIEIKEGDNDRGHWQNFIITGEDKAKVSTFDHSAASLKVGDTIEAEIELKGKFANLKTFHVLEQAAEIKTLEPETTLSRDDVIAQQVAVKAVVEMAVGKVIPPDHPLLKATLAWCAAKLRSDTSLSLAHPAMMLEKLKAVESSGDEEKRTSLEIEKDLLIGLVINHLLLRGNKTAERALEWLKYTEKIPQEKIDGEPKEVAKKLIEKHQWK